MSTDSGYGVSVEDAKSSHGKPPSGECKLLRCGGYLQEHSSDLQHQAHRPHSSSAQIRSDFISQHQLSNLHLEANKKSVQPPESCCKSLCVAGKSPSCPEGWKLRLDLTADSEWSSGLVLSTAYCNKLILRLVLLGVRRFLFSA